MANQPPPAPAADGIFAGKTFCFTGAIQRVDESSGKRYTRKQMQALVVENGGKAVGDVSKGLDFLVLADPSSSSSKARKARDLGTQLLSEEEFFDLVEGRAEL